MTGSSAPSNPNPQARRTLLLIAAVVAAPVLLSYGFYYLFPRGAAANYGELLPTVTLAVTGTRPDGTAFVLEELKGRWVMIFAAGGACDAACNRALFAMRQARTMQNKEMDRVERVWLVTDGVAPSAALLAEHPGLILARTPGGGKALPRGPEPIYLLDPGGHQVLAWPRDPDVKALGRDLSRLLRASRSGASR